MEERNSTEHSDLSHSRASEGCRWPNGGENARGKVGRQDRSQSEMEDDMDDGAWLLVVSALDSSLVSNGVCWHHQGTNLWNADQNSETHLTTDKQEPTHSQMGAQPQRVIEGAYNVTVVLAAAASLPGSRRILHLQSTHIHDRPSRTDLTYCRRCIWLRFVGLFGVPSITSTMSAMSATMLPSEEGDFAGSLLSCCFKEYCHCVSVLFAEELAATTLPGSSRDVILN